MAAEDIGEAMTFGEALRLVDILTRDPDSWVHAALADWEHPASREFFVLADLFDAFVRANTPKGRKVERYPRPLPDKERQVDTFGERIEPADMAEVLRGFGRDVPVDILAWPAYDAPEQPQAEPRLAANPHD